MNSMDEPIKFSLIKTCRRRCTVCRKNEATYRYFSLPFPFFSTSCTIFQISLTMSMYRNIGDLAHQSCLERIVMDLNLTSRTNGKCFPVFEFSLTLLQLPKASNRCTHIQTVRAHHHRTFTLFRYCRRFQWHLSLFLVYISALFQFIN